MPELLARARANKAVRDAAEAKPVPVPTPASSTSSTSSTTTKPVTLAERIANLRKLAAKESKVLSTPIEEVEVTVEVVQQSAQPDTASNLAQTTGMHGEVITYNTRQQKFIDLAASGESGVLIGAAGTGKTTCSQGGIQAIIKAGRTLPLQADGHSHLKDGGVGIIIISYTRRAVNNIRKVQSKEMQNNCITGHKLLEYQPNYFDITDQETGMAKSTMRFIPARNANNPLPESISTIIVEEASMLSVEFYAEVEAALNHTVQWIFIGDIQQLPPVFGSAILGFKMLELPVIELDQVYRQALESPIIRLAHRVLSGKPIPATEYASWKEEGKLTIHPWKKKLNAEHAVMTLGEFFKSAIDKGVYIPDEDMILIPYNKACGTTELNKIIANHIARKHNRFTFEVMAGFNKHYFSEGDKVLYDREDAEIVEIVHNPAYTGTKVQPSSRTLDYWGFNPNRGDESNYHECDPEDVDFMLDAVASSEDRVTQASHKIVVKLLDTEAIITVYKSADVNALLHSYALTVHKSQGSEWRKVFLTIHQSHAGMIQRELLYTGITRAREELYVICEPETFTKGILSQRIKGNTLAEKAIFFKGKL